MKQVFVIRDAGQLPWPADGQQASPPAAVVTDSLATLKALAALGANVCSVESLFDVADLSEIDEASERIAQGWHDHCNVELDRYDGRPLAQLGEFELLNFCVLPAIKTVVLIDRILKKWDPERVWYDPAILRLHEVVATLPEPLRCRFVPLRCGAGAGGGDSLARESPHLLKRVLKAALLAAGWLARVGRVPSGKQILLVTDSTHGDLWEFYRRWPNVLTTSLTLPRSRSVAARLLLQGRVLRVPGEHCWRGHCQAGKQVAPRENRLFLHRGIDVFPILRQDFERVATQCSSYWNKVAQRVERELKRRNVGIVVLPTDAAPLHRLLVFAAERLGIPAMVLQHGLKEYAVDAHDMGTARFAAVWGDWVRAARLARYTQLERVFVVGAPPLDKYFGASRRNGRQLAARTRAATALVLPQSFYRMSAFSDRIHDDRFLDLVLPVLATRPGIGRIVVKPHPAVRPGHVEKVIKDLKCSGPGVSVRYGKLERFLVGEADVVVCANSTGGIEAIAAGIPVICVNVTRRSFSPPLDGRSGIPVAGTQEEFALALDQVLARRCTTPLASDFEAYIGPSDGQSISRTAIAVRQILESVGASCQHPAQPTSAS
ncbi:MAG TPA: hypothetical protein VGS20_04595 [Candidatus Acidoferrales bacterium]|nr:hypothetical protein [Candidatus Acidoferrales bacterium]